MDERAPYAARSPAALQLKGAADVVQKVCWLYLSKPTCLQFAQTPVLYTTIADLPPCVRTKYPSSARHAHRRVHVSRAHLAPALRGDQADPTGGPDDRGPGIFGLFDPISRNIQALDNIQESIE